MLSLNVVAEVISVLAPTRGRPEALQAMATSALLTAAGQIEILAYVDDDDPADYGIDDPLNYLDEHVKFIRGSRITLSDCWNRLAAVASGSILQMASDDIRFRTPEWDTKILDVFDAFPDRIVFAHGRDGIHDVKLGTHGFIHRRWLDTVGYFTWPEFPCDYADTWLHDIATHIGRRVFVPSVLIEHLHPLYKKGEWDETHRERLERGKQADVAGLYKRLEPRRLADAEKLEAACF